ncbi:uncharacterized protein PSFLO_00428 [Pseudozyma flocculosa]|uniref:Uncharacterized protein n=1 Tax=Pseudozyma flocculosa TaxID=84751 RepID=A0A5C3EU02_9BASI|nr:uncharacterized protein PSFLO_00428 [Pseudozyma flocculosa]
MAHGWPEKKQASKQASRQGGPEAGELAGRPGGASAATSVGPKRPSADRRVERAGEFDRVMPGRPIHRLGRGLARSAHPASPPAGRATQGAGRCPLAVRPARRLDCTLAVLAEGVARPGNRLGRPTRLCPAEPVAVGRVLAHEAGQAGVDQLSSSQGRWYEEVEARAQDGLLKRGSS